MKKIRIISIALLLFQSGIFAQFETFYNKHKKIFSHQSVNAFNVDVDSLMLDSIIVDYKNSNQIPGLATMIVKNNKVIWSKNYGYRNREQQLPVEDTTNFLQASVSKLFVATAVMQLWENGTIDLDKSINNYLPDGFTVTNPHFPNDSITTKMLLNHTSSIQDNMNLLWSLNICGDSPIPLDSFLVDYLEPGGKYYNQSNFYNYNPGQTFNYSSVGTSLLALIVEKLSGKSFAEYCQDNIFIPLSMNSAAWFLKGMNTDNIATPYDYDSYGSIASHPICNQGFPYYPSASLRVNKIELSHFLLAYLNNGVYNNHRILDSATVAYILSDQLGYDFDGAMIQGLIWYEMLIYDGSVWGHIGDWYGAETLVGLDPDEKYVLVWLQNWSEAVPPYLKMLEVNSYFIQYAQKFKIIVPVELISFTAAGNAKEVTLTWSTATELNNQGFEIQRRFGSNDFVTIGFVNGYGTTSEQQNYSYADKGLKNGKYYYRLKQIDYNGSFEYSNVVEVEWRTFNTYLLEQNYPNPFNPGTNIGFRVAKFGFVSLKVYDVLGREVATLVNQEKHPGSYEVNFDASKLLSGVYFYKLTAGSFTETKKMILLK